MQREEKFLEDVLKIFHNSKGSVRNTIEKWQSNEKQKTTDDEQLHAKWEPYPEVTYKHASGQYEPLSKDLAPFKNDYSKNKPSFKIAQMNQFVDPSSYEERPSDH